MNYRPRLHTIKVPVDKLVLNPNNPRFLENDEDRDDGNASESGVQGRTLKRMNHPHFRISELKQSIRQNGWLPVDMIFVRKDSIHGFYLVLEGNRRVTAIRELLDGKESLQNLVKASVDPLEVREIVDDGSDDELQAKISYLLGVRHHGSLKEWSPFAQAYNIYGRYLATAGQDDQSFIWEAGSATHVAQVLGLDREQVEARVRVYRAMKQINEIDAVAEAGGMKGHYYSVCEEVLWNRSKNSPLRHYIVQDPQNFLLDSVSLDRMDRLCHFSSPRRANAPINNPAEWRKFEKILADEDEERKAQMIIEVEVQERHPSDVYAERAAELRKPRWDTWLREVAALLGKVNMAQFETTDSALDAAQRLSAVLQQLETTSSRRV